LSSNPGVPASRAVTSMIEVTLAAESCGLVAVTSAASAAAYGVAIDVPLATA